VALFDLDYKTFASVVILMPVTVLAAVQIPLDFRTHCLSRRATFVTAICIFAIAFADSLITRSSGQLLIALVSCSVVLVTYWLSHRLSPNSLGLGDVFLVIPLAFAVAYQSWVSVLQWQLLAALGGVVHVGIVRAKKRQRTIPFGPHLLVSALVVLSLRI